MSDSNRRISKSKLFIENFFIYGFGGIISKLIPLIMLPIVTRLMPDTSYFGISDLSNTVVSFACALAVIGMYDAMYRMFFERDDITFKISVCSTTLCFTVLMSITVFLIMIFSQQFISKWFFGDEKYSYIVYISAATTLVSSTNQIIAAPTRMQNRRKIFLIANTVSPVLSYSISVPLIINGYSVIALPLSAFLSGAAMEITFWILNREWFSAKKFDKKILKELLLIAIPLFPNFLIYWVFNSSDKLMITNLLNAGEVGIYSVGSKLGHVSQLIYTAFAGGWQYFAFSTMKEDNQVESNSKIFEYLGAISFMAGIFVFSLSRVIFNILFTGDYIKGYIVAPYLFLAPLMQMLFQVISNQFLVIKKTLPSMFILLGGAVINIIMNFILIPCLGIEGASIATLVGYASSTFICCIVLLKMKLMTISNRFLGMVFSTAVYILIWRFFTIDNPMISFLLACVNALIICMLYKKELEFVIIRLKGFICRQKQRL